MKSFTLTDGFVSNIWRKPELAMSHVVPEPQQVTPVRGVPRCRFQKGKVKHVYFIDESKVSMSSMDLRRIEEGKIECTRKFFTKITSDQVKHDVVDGYVKLMELVV